jgi:hypothetical protein
MKYFLILVPFVCLHQVVPLPMINDAPLTLIEVERLALDSSYSAKTINAEFEASQNKAEAQRSLLYPKLSRWKGLTNISRKYRLSRFLEELLHAFW